MLGDMGGGMRPLALPGDSGGGGLSRGWWGGPCTGWGLFQVGPGPQVRPLARRSQPPPADLTVGLLRRPGLRPESGRGPSLAPCPQRPPSPPILVTWLSSKLWPWGHVFTLTNSESFPASPPGPWHPCHLPFTPALLLSCLKPPWKLLEPWGGACLPAEPLSPGWSSRGPTWGGRGRAQPQPLHGAPWLTLGGGGDLVVPPGLLLQAGLQGPGLVGVGRSPVLSAG